MDAAQKISDRFGDIVYLRTTYSDKAVRRALADQYGFTDAEIETAIQAADKFISEAGTPNINVETGLLLVRNEQLYQKAITNGKGEQAAQLLRDRLAILTRLNSEAAAEPATAAEVDSLTEQIENARRILEGIDGVRKGLEIEDLAREVLTRFIELEKCRYKGTSGQDTATP